MQQRRVAYGQHAPVAGKGQSAHPIPRRIKPQVGAYGNDQQRKRADGQCQQADAAPASASSIIRTPCRGRRNFPQLMVQPKDHREHHHGAALVPPRARQHRQREGDAERDLCCEYDQ